MGSGNSGSTAARDDAGKSPQESARAKRQRTQAEPHTIEDDSEDDGSARAVDSATRASNGNTKRGSSGNCGSDSMPSAPGESTRKKARNTGQESGTVGSTERAPHAMHSATQAAREWEGTALDTRDDGGDGAAHPVASVVDGSDRENPHVTSHSSTCEGRTKDSAEWRATLRKRPREASGETPPRRRRPRRGGMSDTRVRRVERAGGPAPPMARLIVVGQVTTQRIEGDSGWTKRRRPARGKKRRAPDHDDG